MKTWRILLLAAVMAVVAGCTTTPPVDQPTGEEPWTDPDPDTALIVIAADVFRDVTSTLTDGYRPIDSSVLVLTVTEYPINFVATIEDSLQMDIIMSVDRATMEKLQADGRITSFTPIATNHLVLAVPAGNPGGIKSLKDLTKPEVRLAVCGPGDPCGDLASELITASGLSITPTMVAQSVSDIVIALMEHEADAGFVFVTDTTFQEGILEVVDFGAISGVNLSITHYIAAAKDTLLPEIADAVMAYYLSDEAKETFARAGFGPV
ncbi:MAG: substrate-binding domain-containing protein [Propionibacteriaceae bacterium]|nr:substrate-binding domain-containing protein [Propionibacteriaceae bacterium]